MKTNSKQPSHHDEERGSLRKGLGWGLLALVILGLSLAVWQRSKNHSYTANKKPSAAPNNLRPNKPTASRVQRQGLSSAAVEMRPWERLRATFLHAQSIEDAMEQSAALDRCMKDITPEVAAILLADFSSEDLKGSGALRLLDHWATANPSEAVEWVQAQGDPETRQVFLNVAALRWTVIDLQGAATWARSLPEGNAREEIMAAVGSEAVRSDPLEAMLIGFELPASRAQADLIRRAAAEWAATDRDNAVAWAHQIKDQGLRQLVTEQIVVASAEADPLSAVTIALQQMTPGVEQDRALVSIVQRWVQTDPDLASSWVREFPDGDLGRDAIDNLINLWAVRDSAASGKWLLTLPAGELRDTGLLAYSRALGMTFAELVRHQVLSEPKTQ